MHSVVNALRMLANGNGAITVTIGGEDIYQVAQKNVPKFA